MHKVINTNSPRETLLLGKSIAKSLKSGDIICLKGDLGAGKTVFARGIASGLGVLPQKVISPTFVLIRIYQGRLPVYHFDLYRLKNECDILDLGYEEYLYGSGISIIEWSDKLGELLPRERLAVDIGIGKACHRRIYIEGHEERYGRLLRSLDKRNENER